MDDWEVRPDDPSAPGVRELLGAHLAFAAEQSPPEHVHALDVSALLADDVSFFSIRSEGEVVGVGALKRLDATHGELKSIHTAERTRGRGVGRAMVAHLIDVARSAGMRRVSLETGAMDAFAPSRSLYESFGFVVTEPFGDYWKNDFSVCMTLDLGR